MKMLCKMSFNHYKYQKMISVFRNFNFYVLCRTKLPSSAVSTMSYVNSPQENAARSGRRSLGERLGARGLSPSSDIETSTTNTLSLIRIRDE